MTDRPYLMTSTGWGAQFAGTGIQGSNPALTPFATANLVYVKCAAPPAASRPPAVLAGSPPRSPQRYCSSDLWVGNASASTATFGWAFKGHAIAMAAVLDLVRTQGLGSQPGHRLLYGGCSAGVRPPHGRGSGSHRTRLKTRLPVRRRLAR